MISDWLLLGRPPTRNFIYPSPGPELLDQMPQNLDILCSKPVTPGSPGAQRSHGRKSLRCYTRRLRRVREPQVWSGLTAWQTEARVGRQAALPILGPSISTTDPRPRSSTRVVDR